jgi:hypothetical protein
VIVLVVTYLAWGATVQAITSIKAYSQFMM